MKTHSTIGGDTIRALLKRQPHHSFLQMGMDIAYYHHEKIDGSGYPSGLRGNAIPLPARIVALADVYDALASKRVYKAAMSHDEARAVIRDGRGKHFDPDVVDVCVRLFASREYQFSR
jgi:putative two-component system response regulator